MNTESRSNLWPGLKLPYIVLCLITVVFAIKWAIRPGFDWDTTCTILIPLKHGHMPIVPFHAVGFPIITSLAGNLFPPQFVVITLGLVVLVAFLLVQIRWLQYLGLSNLSVAMYLLMAISIESVRIVFFSIDDNAFPLALVLWASYWMVTRFDRFAFLFLTGLMCGLAVAFHAEWVLAVGIFILYIVLKGDLLKRAGSYVIGLLIPVALLYSVFLAGFAVVPSGDTSGVQHSFSYLHDPGMSLLAMDISPAALGSWLGDFLKGSFKNLIPVPTTLLNRAADCMIGIAVYPVSLALWGSFLFLAGRFLVRIVKSRDLGPRQSTVFFLTITILLYSGFTFVMEPYNQERWVNVAPYLSLLATLSIAKWADDIMQIGHSAYRRLPLRAIPSLRVVFLVCVFAYGGLIVAGTNRRGASYSALKRMNHVVGQDDLLILPEEKPGMIFLPYYRKGRTGYAHSNIRQENWHLFQNGRMEGYGQKTRIKNSRIHDEILASLTRGSKVYVHEDVLEGEAIDLSAYTSVDHDLQGLRDLNMKK